MPWDKSGAKRHKKGLTSPQQKKWKDIANNVKKSGKSDAAAIKIANAMSVKKKKK